ncbi:MAG: hypothetical protein ABL958_15915, partial [Bdellovibrionia bacterium]
MKFGKIPRTATAFLPSLLAIGALYSNCSGGFKPLDQSSTTEAQLHTNCSTISNLNTQSFQGYEGVTATTYAPSVLTVGASEVYVGATGNNAGSVDLFVRRSLDSGDTWENFPVELGTGVNSFANQMLSVNSSLYFSASVVVGTSRHWRLYRSDDRGETWEIVDDFQSGLNLDAQAFGIATDATGAVYVAGSATIGGRETWTVRKSPNGTFGTFTESDSYQPNGTSTGRALAITTTPSDNGVYVIGYMTNGGSTSSLIRKTTDGGATWADFDTFQVAAGRNTFGYAIKAYGTMIFMAAKGPDAANVPHWIVRRAAAVTGPFAQIDDFTSPNATTDIAPLSISQDPSGIVWVAGSTSNGTTYRGVLRKSFDGGTTWSSVQTLPGDWPPNSVASDQSGNIFVSGATTNAATGLIGKIPSSYTLKFSDSCLARHEARPVENGTIREFQPKYQLFSDGASKRRWLFLPQGSKIDTTDMNAWKFPVGTQLWKEFSRGGKKVETRWVIKVRTGT